jgi:uncharacterized protein YjbI with pentapeptide repeats
MNTEQLQQILNEHKEWILDNTKGRRANLRGADLRGADLRGADLSGAYLSGAYLSGAYLSHTDVFIFTLGQHFGFAHFGEQYESGSYVKIGCEGHSLDYWLENFEAIGAKHGYTKSQISNYGKMLNMLNLIKLESDLAKMETK